MAVDKDIVIDQGSEYIEHFLIKDAGGTPIDLVAGSYTARMKVKRDFNAGSATVIDLTTANGRLELHRDGLVGRLSIVLTAPDTDSITIKGRVLDCVYDLELVDGSSVPLRLYDGTLQFIKNITD